MKSTDSLQFRVGQNPLDPKKKAESFWTWSFFFVTRVSNIHLLLIKEFGSENILRFAPHSWQTRWFATHFKSSNYLVLHTYSVESPLHLTMNNSQNRHKLGLVRLPSSKLTNITRIRYDTKPTSPLKNATNVSADYIPSINYSRLPSGHLNSSAHFLVVPLPEKRVTEISTAPVSKHNSRPTMNLITDNPLSLESSYIDFMTETSVNKTVSTDYVSNWPHVIFVISRCSHLVFL